MGALATQGCGRGGTIPVASAAGPITPAAAGTQVASFGWEAVNLNGNGANTYVKVVHNMVLQSGNADLAATILSAKASGFSEILCTGAVSRQRAPNFNPSAQAYVNLPASPNFGSVSPEKSE